MSELVTVTCPRCSAETTALVPAETDAMGTTRELSSGLPPDVDTAVRTDCPNDHGFVVYVADR